MKESDTVLNPILSERDLLNNTTSSTGLIILVYKLAKLSANFSISFVII